MSNENVNQQMLAALKAIYRGYVSTLESGRDRIVSLGGQCDAVDVMERNDPVLRDARAAIAAAEAAQPVAVPDGKQNIGTNPVKDGYFLCKCDECGWIGSSEETESGDDGETYYCPSCRYESPDELISAAQTFNALLSAAQKPESEK